MKAVGEIPVLCLTVLLALAGSDETINKERALIYVSIGTTMASIGTVMLRLAYRIFVVGDPLVQTRTADKTESDRLTDNQE